MENLAIFIKDEDVHTIESCIAIAKFYPTETLAHIYKNTTEEYITQHNLQMENWKKTPKPIFIIPTKKYCPKTKMKNATCTNMDKSQNCNAELKNTSCKRLHVI